MHITFLQLGSNIEDRLFYLNKAISLINFKIGKIISKSSVYESIPWGNSNQGNFLNQVLKVETKCNPYELLDLTQLIELEIGRIKREFWGPRKIDVDILLYDNIIIQSNELEIPHKYIKERMFVLEPLKEIDSDLIIPGVELMNIEDVINNCNDLNKPIKLNT